MTSEPPRLTRTRFVAAGPDQQADGLVGWLSATVDDSLHVDGVALRRTATGRFELVWPSRRDRAGRPHVYVRPVDLAGHRVLLAEAIEAARVQGLIP